MIIKTRVSLSETVSAPVKAMHPYDTPAIVVLPVESVDQRYFAWIIAETSLRSDGDGCGVIRLPGRGDSSQTHGRNPVTRPVQA